MKCDQPCCNKWKRKRLDLLRMIPSLLLILCGVWEFSIPLILGGISLAVLQRQANKTNKILEESDRPWY